MDVFWTSYALSNYILRPGKEWQICTSESENEAGKINVISDIIKRSILYLLEYFWDYCIVGILEVGDAITK